MSCTGCASKFGFLKSEHGCPGCGFSYCGKCLSEKVVLKEGAKPVSVCKNCAITKNPDRRQSQPTESLVRPGDLPPPSMRQAAKARAISIATDKSSGAEDKALRERMERLKQEMRGPSITQTELEIRLAKLKGKDEHVAQKDNPTYFGPDNRTPAQRAADLMQQMREEMELERKLKRPEEELAARLAKLKGETSPEIVQPPSGDVSKEATSTEVPAEEKMDDDKELGEVEKLMRQAQVDAEKEAKAALKCLEKDKELQDQFKRIAAEKAKEQEKSSAEATGGERDSGDEDEAEKLAEMIIEEDEITRRLSQLAPPPSTLGDATPTTPRTEEPEQDELPWCCICTEDACLRCIGCSGDLYCRRCFKEGHDQFDMNDHRTIPYEPKGKKVGDD